MSTQKIEFYGIAIEVPMSERIKFHSYGIDESHPLHAVVVFYYPTLKQVSIHNYSEFVYKFASDSINTNEFHYKTFFQL